MKDEETSKPTYESNKRIVIAGGTGFLGKCLIRKFSTANTEIVVLTRGESFKKGNVQYVTYDAKTIGDWIKQLEGSYAVINVVGRSVNCRYTKKNKSEIINSRVDATHIIGEAIQQCIQPPSVWINAGSAAIFGDSGEEIKTEHAETGNGFSAEVCKQWEKAFQEIITPGTRKVFLRIGLVLQKGEGLLKPFLNMVCVGIGGKFGSGKQYITWIHEVDFTNIVEWCIENKRVSGILHCSSPYPVNNATFMKQLRKAKKIYFGFPNPAFLIRIGALLIGTEAELILNGRRVTSSILEENKFVFQYPHLDKALIDLI